ncbi:hypothetical protein MTO96_039975 [Rhipicephalus appendiculatus]
MTTAASASATSMATSESDEEPEYVEPKRHVLSPADMKRWMESEAYSEYVGFVLALNERVKGKKLNDATLPVYIDAAAPDATPERKKVLLLNALGVEGLHTYYKAADEQTQLDGDQATGDGAARDAYQQALAVLDTYFAPPEEAVCMGDAFTIQSALEHAREEERVDRALQQLTALQVDSATRREPDAAAVALLDLRCNNMHPFILHRRPRRVSATAAVRLTTGRIFRPCPARWRTCNSCGKQGHFSEMPLSGNLGGGSGR